MEVRGEVYFPLSGFRRFNEEQVAAGQGARAESRATPPRARCASSTPGSRRRVRSSVWIYGTGYREGVAPDTHFETLAWLRERGFRTNPFAERLESIEEVAKACAEWERRRAELDYEIDGIVVKVDSFDQQQRLGALHDRPRWARAFKWAPMTAETKLLKIAIRVGRTGALNPWAIMEPVNVGGVMVSRATLHNEEDINRKQIREGDRVIVQRAGDVIPQIVGPARAAREGHEGVQDARALPALRRRDREARGRGHAPLSEPRLPVARARDAEQLGDGGDGHRGRRRAVRLAALERGAAPLDARSLPSDRGAADGARGLRRDLRRGTRSTAIALSKQQPFSRVLFGLNIPDVGWVTARNLARHFGDVDKLLDASQEEIQEVEGIGPDRAEAIAEWFSDEQNRTLVAELRELGLRFEVGRGGEADRGPADGQAST